MKFCTHYGFQIEIQIAFKIVILISVFKERPHDLHEKYANFWSCFILIISDKENTVLLEQQPLSCILMIEL